MKLRKILLGLLSGFLLQMSSPAAVVGLQSATATFSQTYAGNFSVGTAINGTPADGLGWSIYPETGPQTAVFETVTNIGFTGGSLLKFTLNHAYAAWGQHIIGRFRISVTTDDRSSFADGLATGGNVTANWTVLDPLSVVSSSGATLSKLPDLSILASGVLPNTDVYTFIARTTLTNITGVRLEALTDPTLPANRPGRQKDNGNFALSEFTVEISPDERLPAIQIQPQSQLGIYGKEVTFSVLATGAPSLSYQWQRNGGTIAGATTAALELTNLQLTAGGSYAVVVTNDFGSITSNPALLTINPAGVSLALYPGVSIEGVVGLTYGIQTTTNLSNSNSWIGVINLTLDAPNRLWFDTTPATQVKRYYRVVPGPIAIP